MTEPRARTVPFGGEDLRIWEKGRGEPIVFLAGFGGLPRWTAFLETLSQSRHVFAPSLPGFPGGGRAHEKLDSHMDWLIATHDVVAAAGARPVDVVGVSLGGALAADVAAVWPELVRRLVLVSPLGLYDPNDPPADVFAQRPDMLAQTLTADPQNWPRHIAKPEGFDDLEWSVLMLRANEAAARLLWPLSDTGLAKRLKRIAASSLIVMGERDNVLPKSYARTFADGIGAQARIKTLDGAGHLADLDAPDQLARMVLAFCGAAAPAARRTAGTKQVGRRKPAPKRMIPKRGAAKRRARR
jgi:pimeloyl-ACP methyl ester carboxylesterase